MEKNLNNICDANEIARIDREYDRVIFLNRLGLKMVGIWPLERDCSRSRVILRKLHLFIVYLLLFSVMIPQWLGMYLAWGDVDAYTEILMSNIFIAAVMMKITNFVRSMRLFQEILETMHTNWIRTMKMSNSDEDKEIMYDLSTKAYNRGTNYCIIIFAAGSAYAIVPIIKIMQESPDESGNRYYPFFGTYYFDKNSDLIYWMCYLNQVITGTMAAVANYATDAIFLVCVYHFCGQLRLLQNDFKSLGNSNCNDGMLIKKKLAKLIQRHQTEIRNGYALQAIFSASSLQQVLVSCIIICVNGFKLIVSLANHQVDVLMYAFCLPLTLLQILFYCQPGNELLLQSQLLNEAIYQSSWINLDPVLARHLVFMIQRSQKPLAIIAGKIYVLSLENFMNILKKSMSALSVLQAMYRKNIHQMQ